MPNLILPDNLIPQGSSSYKGTFGNKNVKKMLYDVIMGDKVFPENQGVFRLIKEVAFHCFTVFVCGSFACYCSGFSGFCTVLSRTLLIQNQEIFLDVKLENLVYNISEACVCVDRAS
ncbi:MAG: hypothetical protein H8D56_21115 [Planctomycetes bacterium]|nr:hypothetical protein [Planctomycetota bacterium]MBL7145544.1 hypothetical protein [Phycisphaerae bacterium]